MLVTIGQGRARPSWASDVLQARDRKAAGIAAPAQGLCLLDVLYPARWGLPAPRAPWPAALGALA